jgi:hypothetical protein
MSSLNVIAISSLRSVVGRSAILRLSILACPLVFHFLPMMLDHTARCGTQNGMMSRDMSNDAANGRTFQAPFGGAHRGQQRKTDANGETGSNLAHFHSPDEYR